MSKRRASGDGTLRKRADGRWEADLSSVRRKTDCRCINASSVNHKKKCSRRWTCTKKISKVLNCAKITA